MNLENCYANLRILDLKEGSGKCQKINGCKYLCDDTFKKLSQEDGIKQLIICASDYLFCHLNKNPITIN